MSTIAAAMIQDEIVSKLLMIEWALVEIFDLLEKDGRFYIKPGFRYDMEAIRAHLKHMEDTREL